jgi:hypothetical protein
MVVNSKTKLGTVSWLNHKIKVELRLHGSRVMSGECRRPHLVHGVSSGSPENHWVPGLIHKAKTEDGGAAASRRSDWWYRSDRWRTLV